MQLSDKKTDWLLVIAYGDSENDPASFVLIHLTPEYLRAIRQYASIAEGFSFDPCFPHIAYTSTVEGWYPINDNSGAIISQMLLEDRMYAFVELDEGELERLNPTEEHIRGQQAEIFDGDYYRHTGSGQYDGERYWTEHLPIALFKQ